VHPGDDRHRAGAHGEHDLHEQAAPLVLLEPGGVVGHAGQVGARAEHLLPGAGDHDHPRVADAAQRLEQPAHHLTGQRVAPGLPVDRQPQHRAVALHPQVSHGPQTMGVGLVVAVLVGALVVGRATGGSLARLAEVPLRWRRLVAAAVAVQALGVVLAVSLGGGSGPAYAATLAASAALVLAFVALNRRLPGMPLVAAGLVLNAAVVAANGAMPVSLDAAARAGVETRAIALGSDPRHVIAGDQTRWDAIGDVVPVALPWRPEVVSPGDVLVAAGLAQLISVGMRRRST